MGIVIGIDGGGTKTRFAAYDLSEKKLIGSLSLGGTDYKQDGFETVAGRLRAGVAALIKDCPAQKIDAISFGMPCYSEDPEGDKKMADCLNRLFAHTPCFLFNDVYVALEGAFYGRAGILVVAGTGSLAYGRDKNGLVDRCGGWSEFFGDEGSGYWIGKQLLETFSKQSDGRMNKSLIYELTRRYFGLKPDENDFKILKRAECNSGDRAATARMNLIVKQAADQGDPAALHIYQRAVDEIAGLVCALRNKMNFYGTTEVAVSGGLFCMEQYITKPFENILQKEFETAVGKPVLGPCCGAVVLAVEKLKGYEQASFIYGAMSKDERCREL